MAVGVSSMSAFPSELSESDIAGMDEALRRLGEAADQADSEAAGADGWFQHILGNESAVEGARSSAVATRHLYDVMRNKRPTVATHEQAFGFVQACAEGANVSDITLVARQSSIANAVSDVTAASVADVKTGLKFALPAVAAVAVAVGAVALFLYMPRVRA